MLIVYVDLKMVSKLRKKCLTIIQAWKYRLSSENRGSYRNPLPAMAVLVSRIYVNIYLYCLTVCIDMVNCLIWSVIMNDWSVWSFDLLEINVSILLTYLVGWHYMCSLKVFCVWEFCANIPQLLRRVRKNWMTWTKFCAYS